MKFIFKNLFVIVLLTFISVIPVLSLADTVQPIYNSGTTTSTTINNPIGVSNIQDFIKILLEGVIKIGLPIVALAIIYSGFLFVSARGNTESLKKAKSSLLYSIIGAAILLGAWGIAQLIASTVLKLG
jgi:hypothetical protein